MNDRNNVDPPQEERQFDTTVKDYFETDYFSRNRRKMSANYIFRLEIKGEDSGREWSVLIQQKLNFDYEANAVYSYFYIPPLESGIDTVNVCQWLAYYFVQSPLRSAPPAMQYDMSFRNNDSDRYRSSKRLIDTRQMVIYLDVELSEQQKEQVYQYGDRMGMYVQIRDRNYAHLQSSLEQPLAFISYDHRDRDTIARPLAQELTRIIGRVWFDEYALRVGDNLRESIERGLRECQRCILILTQSYLSNTGWTKTEFNSVFTRELLEKKNVIIPVWAGVTPEQVYAYSPSLVNKLAAIWDDGAEAVALKVRSTILDRE